MNLITRRYEGDDLRDSLISWTYLEGHYWGVGVCVPLPKVYWALTVRYRTKFTANKWTARTRTFPRRP